jgi:transposase
MSQQSNNCAIAVIGIDIGKNSFHVVGHDARGAIALRQKWSRAKWKRGSPMYRLA